MFTTELNGTNPYLDHMPILMANMSETQTDTVFNKNVFTISRVLSLIDDSYVLAT